MSKEYIKKFKKAREKVIECILNDPSLSKKKKIKLLTKYDLFEVGFFVSDVFNEWNEECAKLERKTAIAAGKDPEKDYICNYGDEQLSDCENRYYTVYYMDIINNLKHKETNEEGKYLVAICRGDYRSKLYKSKEEIIDKFYDYIVENKEIGFVYDW